MYNLTDSTQGILIDCPTLFTGVTYLSRCHIFTTLRKCIPTSCVDATSSLLDVVVRQYVAVARALRAHPPHTHTNKVEGSLAIPA